MPAAKKTPAKKPAAKSVTPKRGPGRPRKTPEKAAPAKRGPGRPRKTLAAKAKAKAETAPAAEAPKRKRGRPPKDPNKPAKTNSTHSRNQPQAQAELRLMNKFQLAVFMDVSQPTVTNWTRRGCPYVQQGQKGGDQWIFDAYEVAKWYFRTNGGKGAAADRPIELMSPNERKNWYDSEARRIRLEESQGRLIPVESLEEAISTAFAALAQGLQGLPDTVERRTGCEPDVVEAVQTVVEAEMESLATQLSKLGPTDSVKNDESADDDK